MAFKANDGSQHTNYSSYKSANAKMASMPTKAPAAAAPDDQGGPPPIESDPEAMQCVETLKQKGYTADDVEMAMGQSEQQEAPPPAAAGPGMM